MQRSVFRRKATVDRIMVCPLCGMAFIGASALSRSDGWTRICLDCGSRQAMEALGISPEERERIIQIMHGRQRRII